MRSSYDSGRERFRLGAVGRLAGKAARPFALLGGATLTDVSEGQHSPDHFAPLDDRRHDRVHCDGRSVTAPERVVAHAERPAFLPGAVVRAVLLGVSRAVGPRVMNERVLIAAGELAHGVAE